MTSQMQKAIMDALDVTAKAIGFGEPKTIPEIVGTIIGAFLSLLGIILVCLIIYGGFLWMTAGGNEYKVLKAKGVLNNAIIGLIIILSSYGITLFVMNAMISATYK